MDIAGSVYFPKDCHLSPDRFMARLKQQCDAAGVKFRWGADAARMSKTTRSDGKTQLAGIGIAGSAEEIAADEFVLACGSWSSALGRELGLRLPMQAGKGYSLTLLKPRQLPQICSILT